MFQDLCCIENVFFSTNYNVILNKMDMSQEKNDRKKPSYTQNIN